MKLIAMLALLSVLLSACAAPTLDPGTIQTAIAQTQAAVPTSTPIPATPTPTLIPLSDVNLEGILLLEGDLPTDFIGQQITSRSDKFQSAPSASQFIQQKFRAGPYASDGITIFLYDSLSDLDKAYSYVTDLVGRNGKPEALSDVGEKAVIHEDKSLGPTSVQVIFLRCHAIVYIDLFSETAHSDVATTYAQRVDKRLQPLVCR